MRNTLETRLGIFFALALIAGVVILELAGTRDLFSKGYPLRARFDVRFALRLVGLRLKHQSDGPSLRDHALRKANFAPLKKLNPESGDPQRIATTHHSA